MKSARREVRRGAKWDDSGESSGGKAALCMCKLMEARRTPENGEEKEGDKGGAGDEVGE